MPRIDRPRECIQASLHLESSIVAYVVGFLFRMLPNLRYADKCLFAHPEQVHSAVRMRTTVPLVCSLQHSLPQQLK